MTNLGKRPCRGGEGRSERGGEGGRRGKGGKA